MDVCVCFAAAAARQALKVRLVGELARSFSWSLSWGFCRAQQKREQGGRSEWEDKERRGSWIDAKTVAVQ